MESRFRTSNPCRLCLSHSDFQTPIFGDKGQKLGVHFKIKSCFPSLQVDEKDGLPENICYRCLNSLEQTYEFWTKCCTSEAVLSKFCIRKYFIKHNYETKQESKTVEHRIDLHQSNDSDESENDWFIWDATYKICTTEEKTSRNIPIDTFNRGVKRDISNKFPVLSSNTSSQMQKHEKELCTTKGKTCLKKIDSCQEETSESIPQTIPVPDTSNFVSGFWKHKPLNSMTQSNAIIAEKPLYCETVKQNNFLSSQLSQKTDEKRMCSSQQSKYENVIYFCVLENNDVISLIQELTGFINNPSQYNDMFTNAKNLLKRFRDYNNSRL